MDILFKYCSRFCWVAFTLWLVLRLLRFCGVCGDKSSLHLNKAFTFRVKVKRVTTIRSSKLFSRYGFVARSSLALFWFNIFAATVTSSNIFSLWVWRLFFSSSRQLLCCSIANERQKVVVVYFEIKFYRVDVNCIKVEQQEKLTTLLSRNSSQSQTKNCHLRQLPHAQACG